MLYFQVFKLKFKRFLAYPWEMAGIILKRIVEIVFLIIFWSLITRASSEQIEFRRIVSYFFLAIGIGDIVMARWGGLGGTIGRRIQLGEISDLMLKPMNVVFVLYARTLGTVGVRMILAIVYIVIGIAIYPPTSFVSLILFVLYFTNAVIISFCLNVITGAVYFHLTDASGFRNAYEHMVRLVSGALIPIYLFPDNIERIIKLSPFPAMIFGPANALSVNNFSAEVAQELLFFGGWSLMLIVFSKAFWRYSTKKYEAVGI